MIGGFDPHVKGVLFPEKCVAAHLESGGQKQGADLHYNEPVRRWHPDGEGVRVFTDQRRVHRRPDRILSRALGTPRFVSKLKLPLRLERQVLFWFQPASSPELFRT